MWARARLISSPGTTFHGCSGVFLGSYWGSNDSSNNMKHQIKFLLDAVFFYSIILWCLYFHGGAEKMWRSGWWTVVKNQTSVFLTHLVNELNVESLKLIRYIFFFCICSLFIIQSWAAQNSIPPGIIIKERPWLSTTFRNFGKFYHCYLSIY